MSGSNLTPLSEAEEELSQAFVRGALVDLTEGPDDRPHLADAWDEKRCVRAEVIAALLLGVKVSEAGAVPTLRLAGAQITGALLLARATIEHVVEFTHCLFDEGVDLSEAKTQSFRLRGCYLPFLEVGRVDVRGEFELAGCRMDWLSVYASRLGEAEFSGTTLHRPGDTALNGDLLTVDAAMYCHDMRITGQMRPPGAHIRGSLELDGSHVINDADVAVKAEIRARASGAVHGDVRRALRSDQRRPSPSMSARSFGTPSWGRPGRGVGPGP